MVTLATSDLSVTTWGEQDGQTLWRANDGTRIAYFTAERDADDLWLMTVAAVVLGHRLDTNAADMLSDGSLSPTCRELT